MKTALFSPVNPVKSGISDYTEELLPYLSRHLDIDLYIDPSIGHPVRDLARYCTVLPFEPDDFNPANYQQILYHFGNSYHPHRYLYRAFMKFPGIVVLHDYVMLGFYCEKYFSDNNFGEFSELLERTYPRRGREIARALASRTPAPIWNRPEGIRFPMNEEIVSRARGLVVHSDFVRRRILRKHRIPVAVIPHHGHEEKEFDDTQTRRELGLRQKDLLLVSAGFINQNKRFHLSIPAVTELDAFPITFLIIGRDEASILKRILRRPNPRIITRGFLPLEDMERYISAADICINLRYPTMGESSGSLLRMMGYGKPVLVSDCGSYRELPDYTVLKVPTDIYEKDILQAYLKELTRSRDLRESIGREARQYVKGNCDIRQCADQYVRFIRDHSAGQRPVS